MTRFVLLIVLAAALVGVSIQLSLRGGYAAFPGANGKIAFTSSRSGSPQIYLVDPVTRATIRLTDSPWSNLQPAWSPDGSRIAFLSTRDDGAPNVYIMKADGSEQTRLTNNADRQVDIESPSWSPDGSKIIFVYGDPKGEIFARRDIYAINADGSGQANLTKHAADYYSPVWSPDGSKIAFIGNRDADALDSFDLEVMDADGTNVVRLTDDRTGTGRAVSWSPDGSRLAYELRNAVYIVRADGINPRTITDTRISADWSPDWSPDGTKLLLMHSGGDDPDPHEDIFIADVDGSHGASLTRGGLGMDGGPHWQPLPIRGIVGDVDCNGSVNGLDRALLLRWHARVLESLRCVENADVNHDGEVNSIDAALILQRVAGLLSRLPP